MKPQKVFHCAICGIPFVVYGQVSEHETCEKPYCILEAARRDAATMKLPLTCGCPQRPYKHDIAIHRELRRESYNPALRGRWPWILADIA